MSNFRPIDFDNSDAMEKLFLKMQCIEADTRRNKKNQNSPKPSKEIKFMTKNFSIKKPPGPNGFIEEFNPTGKKSSQPLPGNTGEGNTSQLTP